MSRFKRRWNPTCYVCHKPIRELHDMKKMREANMTAAQIDDHTNTITRKVICVGHYKNGNMILRHNNGFCEPGGDNYMKNPKLAETYTRFREGIPEKKKWWENLPNVIRDTHINV